MAVSGDGSSMLKDMLDEIREELCVDYIELKNQEQTEPLIRSAHTVHR